MRVSKVMGPAALHSVPSPSQCGCCSQWSSAAVFEVVVGCPAAEWSDVLGSIPLYMGSARASDKESGMKASGRAQTHARQVKPPGPGVYDVDQLLYFTQKPMCTEAVQPSKRPTSPQVVQATKSQSFKSFLPNTWIQLCSEGARMRVRVRHASGTSVP